MAVIDVDPAAQLHLEHARHAILEGDFERAADAFSRIPSILRGQAAVLQVQWLIQAEAGNWEHCLEVARTLTQLRPKRSACWIALAKSLLRNGRCDEARAVLERVAPQFPDDEPFQAMRARAQREDQGRGQAGVSV